MSKKIIAGVLMSSVVLLAGENSKNPMTQTTAHKSVSANVIVYPNQKTLIMDRLSVEVSNENLLKIYIDKGKDNNKQLILTKKVEICDTKEGKYIDNYSLGYSLIDEFVGVNVAKENQVFKKGYEIHLAMCKVDKARNAFYVDFHDKEYGVENF